MQGREVQQDTGELLKRVLIDREILLAYFWTVVILSGFNKYTPSETLELVTIAGVGGFILSIAVLSENKLELTDLMMRNLISKLGKKKVDGEIT